MTGEIHTHIHEKTINVQLTGQKQSAQSITETIIEDITKINYKRDHGPFIFSFFKFLVQSFIRIMNKAKRWI